MPFVFRGRVITLKTSNPLNLPHRIANKGIVSRTQATKGFAAPRKNRPQTKPFVIQSDTQSTYRNAIFWHLNNTQNTPNFRPCWTKVGQKNKKAICANCTNGFVMLAPFLPAQKNGSGGELLEGGCAWWFVKIGLCCSVYEKLCGDYSAFNHVVKHRFINTILSFSEVHSLLCTLFLMRISSMKKLHEACFPEQSTYILPLMKLNKAD